MTKYLNKRAPSFRMPGDKSLPIIMVGAGTGIAPFRSFWQERKVEMKMLPIPKGGWGEVDLYFGCRQANLDELYKSEIDELIKDNVLSFYFAAYSREKNIKTYVQDLIAQNFERVHHMLFEKKGHIYICGYVGMAADVTNQIELGLKHKFNISLEEAKSYINEMRVNIKIVCCFYLHL